MTLAAPRLGRFALRCWLFATGLYLLALIVGTIVSATGPGGDTVRTWAAVIYPMAVSVVAMPLLVAAVVLAVSSFIAEGTNWRAVIALLLSLTGLVPSFFFIAQLLPG